MCSVLNKFQKILSIDENLHEDVIKLTRNNHPYVNIHNIYRKDTIVCGRLHFALLYHQEF